jgi:uridine kinase
MSNKITITIHGQEYTYLAGQTYQNIARDFKDQYPHDIILARVNGRLRELFHTAEKDCTLDFVTTGEKSGNQVYQRTACMIMYKAFEDVLGRDNIYKLDVEYSLSDGLFCTLQAEEKLTASLLKSVKKQI